MVDLAQVRIESAAKQAAKVAAARVGMSQEAWITAAINEKLEQARLLARYGGKTR